MVAGGGVWVILGLCWVWQFGNGDDDVELIGWEQA